jgi:hypothetical protein
VCDEVEREVERADRTDNADRDPQRERELVLAHVRRIHRHHLAGERARRGGREREGGDGSRSLDASRLDRLCRFFGDRTSEVLGPLGEQTRRVVEDLGALPRRERRLRSHISSRPDGAVHLRGATGRNAPDLVTIER